MTASLPPGFLPRSVHAADAAVVRLDDLGADAGTGMASRLLAAHDGGKALLLALADGAVLAEHTVPFAVLAVVLDGEAVFTRADETVSVRAGDALRLTPRERHRVRAVGPLRLLLVMHRP